MYPVEGEDEKPTGDGYNENETVDEGQETGRAMGAQGKVAGAEEGLCRT